MSIDRIIHIPSQKNGRFNGLCFDHNIVWIFSCYHCKIDLCMYCAVGVVRCWSCCKYRCKSCAVEHDKTKCYLENIKKR